MQNPLQDEGSECDELKIHFRNIYEYESQHDSDENLKSKEKKSTSALRSSEEVVMRCSRR